VARQQTGSTDSVKTSWTVWTAFEL